MRRRLPPLRRELPGDGVLIAPVPLGPRPWICVISDFRDGWPPAGSPERSIDAARRRWQDVPLPVADADRAELEVTGGYLERLPLACVKAGIVERAEIWHHWRAEGPTPCHEDGPFLLRRGFELRRDEPPFASNDMLGFVQAHGAPAILVVLGLGVDARLLDACADSFKVYNSIDAPALRVPAEVGGRFDLVLTGADWQSAEVRARHPGMACAVMPIGPEFADPVTFRPLDTAKPYDLVYVAAAQPYKRHDLLFDALERLPRTIRTLCVFGYGEMADELRQRAAGMGLAVDFVGPPGVPFAEVNRLMNQARIGLVCGIDDGAPAILTEYMLAGLPVLANAHLRCGLQFITSRTGMAAPGERFDEAILAMLADLDRFAPREEVLAKWTWQHSIRRFADLLPASLQARLAAAK